MLTHRQPLRQIDVLSRSLLFLRSIELTPKKHVRGKTNTNTLLLTKKEVGDGNREKRRSDTCEEVSRKKERETARGGLKQTLQEKLCILECSCSYLDGD